VGQGTAALTTDQMGLPPRSDPPRRGGAARRPAQVDRAPSSPQGPPGTGADVGGTI